MCARGFSLVELLVVIAIMGILLSIATLNWNAMQTKSAIESQIKMIHADLMEVRVQALYSKTPRSVVISGQQYKVYSSTDTSVAPLVTKQLRYPVVWKNGAGTLTFDAQGLTTNMGSLCVLPTNSTADLNSAAVDSIVVSQARINFGKRTGTVGGCISENIEQK
jgi:prepilin-type N-terminal cleavage/methylation domain-containing protein